MADFIILSVKNLLSLTVRVISVMQWYVLSTHERSVSLLSMYFEDTRYKRWVIFILRFCQKKHVHF